MVGGLRSTAAAAMVESILVSLNDDEGNQRQERPTVIGKPNPYAIELICKNNGIADKSKVVMIGDRMDTDIVFGNRAGIETVLVMTGCTESNDQIEHESKLNEECRPKFLLNSLD